MREYYFRRRHLARGRAYTGHRRLKYEIERDSLCELMADGLKFIKERDGAEILKEVSVQLLIELLKWIEALRGSLPTSQRSLLKELRAERFAADDKIHADLGHGAPYMTPRRAANARRTRRAGTTKAIAA
jgi:hypothetical protein